MGSSQHNRLTVRLQDAHAVVRTGSTNGIIDYVVLLDYSVDSLMNARLQDPRFHIANDGTALVCSAHGWITVTGSYRLFFWNELDELEIHRIKVSEGDLGALGSRPPETFQGLVDYLRGFVVTE